VTAGRPVGRTWSAHISWLFSELPHAERVPAARRAGFSRIESAWPERAADRDGLVRAVREQGVEVVLLNCPAGDTGAGERGFLNDPARREEAEQGLLAAAELAASVGAVNLNVLVGRELPQPPASEQRRALVQTLQALAGEASARGLRLLIEPVNAIENPGYLAPTPEDALALIEECGADGLGVLLDVYHVARAGGDPVAEIERCRELIGHVQVSDHPGRGRPGSGALDFARIFEALRAAGYEGSVGLEYEPQGPTERSLALLWDERYPVSL
jgi:hydroxypyruvate isomerase